MAFFGVTPRSVLQASPGTTLHSPWQRPSLPRAHTRLTCLQQYFFNTRANWESTNHCNYVQWGSIAMIIEGMVPLSSLDGLPLLTHLGLLARLR